VKRARSIAEWDQKTSVKEFASVCGRGQDRWAGLATLSSNEVAASIVFVVTVQKRQAIHVNG
jgi:hypothetical protein